MPHGGGICGSGRDLFGQTLTLRNCKTGLREGGRDPREGVFVRAGLTVPGNESALREALRPGAGGGAMREDGEIACGV